MIARLTRNNSSLSDQQNMGSKGKESVPIDGGKGSKKTPIKNVQVATSSKNATTRSRSPLIATGDSLLARSGNKSRDSTPTPSLSADKKTYAKGKKGGTPAKPAPVPAKNSAT